MESKELYELGQKVAERIKQNEVNNISNAIQNITRNRLNLEYCRNRLIEIFMRYDVEIPLDILEFDYMEILTVLLGITKMYKNK